MEIITKNIRNFSIIAHIDHGKSTLADRIIEITGTVPKEKMKAQLLDTMDLEREKGITIKMQPVMMKYSRGNQNYLLNLIDTPGHVDFAYEVSRSLAAVEGAILLIDASQGIQAQTLSNLRIAEDEKLKIIPVINKIDLPNLNIQKIKEEIVNILKVNEDEIMMISAKTGQGVDNLIKKIIEKIPPPRMESSGKFKGLIFDSIYNEYKGIITYVRVFNQEISVGENISFFASDKKEEIEELGVFIPDFKAEKKLYSGQIGFFITGLKSTNDCRVGDTIVKSEEKQRLAPLPGYKNANPMVFAGIFLKEGKNIDKLREAITRLSLNDSSFSFEPESSNVLGYGFRCGFLGLLHLEIFKERIKREFDIDLVITTPSVAYKIIDEAKSELLIKNPEDFSKFGPAVKILEPWVDIEMYLPKTYLGQIIEYLNSQRGIYMNLVYLEKDLCLLKYQMPLTKILTNFYDNIKSYSSGYASYNYKMIDWRKADVVKLDIYVAEDIQGALSLITYNDEAYREGKAIVKKLKDILPKEMFEIKLQAKINGKVIASEKIPPVRKDVTAKLYGGDVTRKMKLLKKQKKGKQKMKHLGKGSVNISTNVYLEVLKR